MRCRRCRRRSVTARTSTGGSTARGLTHAKRLWQAVDIEAGLGRCARGRAARAPERARACAISTPRSRWVADGDAAAADGSPRIRGRAADSAPAAMRDDALFAKVRIAAAGVARVLADGLHGVRCRADLAAALADRASLASGETFVTPEGHRVSAHSGAVLCARQRIARRAGAPARADRARAA